MYRPITGSHIKVKDKYLFYTIMDVGEEYELTIEINHKIKEQIRNKDDKILRVYISGFISGMYLFRND